MSHNHTLRAAIFVFAALAHALSLTCGLSHLGQVLQFSTDLGSLDFDNLSVEVLVSSEGVSVLQQPRPEMAYVIV